MILVNGSELKVETFPNGEKKIKTPWLDNGVTVITMKWESDQDLINLMFLKAHLDNYPFGMRGAKGVNLEILYVPYSRMDRDIPGDLFTLKTLCRFINDMKFNEVIVYEPHSSVTPTLLDRCTVVDMTMELFRDFAKKTHVDYVCYPDEGASKRYHTGLYNSLVGHKVRNAQTGRIESYDIVPPRGFDNLDGATVVILDDLSSYGGTFLHCAKALKVEGAGDIYLIVTHAEHSIFKGEIFSSGLFKKVLTTNSILDITDTIGRSDIEVTEIY